MKLPPRTLPAATALVLAGLGGCLSIQQKADFEAGLRGWVGRPLAEFPQGAYDSAWRPAAAGSRVYTFERRGSQPGFGVSGGAASGASAPQGVRIAGALFCRIILEVDNRGIIISSRYEGNDCW